MTDHRTILHIDMNAFFASVEQQANPELRGKPITVVGGHGRTMITTSSYEARAKGVKTGMAIWEGKRTCPELIIYFLSVLRRIYKKFGGVMSTKEILNYQIALQKIIFSRLLKSEYVDIDSFFKVSGLSKHLNALAANRCFNDKIKPVHPLSMALVMKFLGFSHSEILIAIDKLGGTKYLILFEDLDTRKLENSEEGLLSAFRKIKDKPHVLDDVVNFLTNISNMHNVNVSSEISQIRVPKRIIITKGSDNKAKSRLVPR